MRQILDIAHPSHSTIPQLYRFQERESQLKQLWRVQVSRHSLSRCDDSLTIVLLQATRIGWIVMGGSLARGPISSCRRWRGKASTPSLPIQEVPPWRSIRPSPDQKPSRTTSAGTSRARSLQLRALPSALERSAFALPPLALEPLIS